LRIFDIAVNSIFIALVMEALSAVPFCPRLAAQTITIDGSPAARRQVIDGFGTCLSGIEATQSWWQNLYFDDLRASILRIDITPAFRSPYSDKSYNSPDYSVPGPNGNYVRTYEDAASYTNLFAGRRARIAVMGPNIDANINYFDFSAAGPHTAGVAAQVGRSHRSSLGDFKLIASLWSPSPWLKTVSGHVYSGGGNNMPARDTAFPFIWLGNFSGGMLDTSGEPRPEFDDSALGGSGPTSVLTQFARCTAAYLRGFQRAYGVSFYAISIQNELAFDEFYNSCCYPQSSGYLTALKTVRSELNKYPDLAHIKIMGPEDVLGSDAYGMWQYGEGPASAKNLQFLQDMGADPVASAAAAWFCIHGYASDGIQAADATPGLWNWWVNGWGASPATGLPSDVHGFAYFHKKSWMTETSGEDPAWLSPAGGFPGGGAWGLALRIQQALTAGQESAWLYWQMTDGKPVSGMTLTDENEKQNSAKYVAAKHFFRYIRPNSIRVDISVSGAPALSASAFLQLTNRSITVVIINSSGSSIQAVIESPAEPPGIDSWQIFTSKAGNYWQPSTNTVVNGRTPVNIPGFGVVTLYGVAPK
jgi:O-glycosyl hydrolase